LRGNVGGWGHQRFGSVWISIIQVHYTDGRTGGQTKPKATAPRIVYDFSMRIAFITAGAAGMYCGSCMKDNTLTAALNALGHDALLIPTYTPIRTDEENVSASHVFLGGVNVFLQEKVGLFRHTPRFLDRLFDSRGLLRWAGKFAVRTRVERLGGLTISMLKGADGNQHKEMRRLVDWLTTEFRPEVVLLTNVLLSGLIPALRSRFDGPMLATLQGDDIFLDALPPADRATCIELIRRNCESLDGYLVTSQYYADFMAQYLGLPRDRMHVVYPGINPKGHGSPRSTTERPPYTIGYFARICPDKGLHNLVEAYLLLRKASNSPHVRLRISGWLGGNHRPYLDEQLGRLRNAGFGADVEHVDCPTHADKVRFFQSIDVLSVPTVYREPKGLYVLEAMMNGVPVVLPRHGTFPELIEATGGGVLTEPGNAQSLATALGELLLDPNRLRKMGESGRQAVFARFTAETMARETIAVLEPYHQRHIARTPNAEALRS
jgi:glycosyltransferase involved in cell wall biosynthesis